MHTRTHKRASAHTDKCNAACGRCQSAQNLCKFHRRSALTNNSPVANRARRPAQPGSRGPFGGGGGHHGSTRIRGEGVELHRFIYDIRYLEGKQCVPACSSPHNILCGASSPMYAHTLVSRHTHTRAHVVAAPIGTRNLYASTSTSIATRLGHRTRRSPATLIACK